MRKPKKQPPYSGSAGEDGLVHVVLREGGRTRALRILERARDIAQTSMSPGIELAHVGQAAERLGIDENVLDRLERSAVKLLLARGRPMGVEAMAARLGVDLETFREVHEPWLERAGLIERTERGRVATAEARAIYGEDPARAMARNPSMAPRALGALLAGKAGLPRIGPFPPKAPTPGLPFSGAC